MGETPKIIKKSANNFLLPAQFRTNAYHILGLNTTADQKLIQRRGNEIINRIKIEDIPVYDLDIDPADTFRTVDSVKKAVQDLSSPKNSVKGFFFWFDLGSEQKNSQLIAAIQQQNNNFLFPEWGYKPQNSHAKNWINQKNLVLYKTIIVFNGKNKQFLNESLDLWKRLFESDDYWEVFFDNYQARLGFEKNIAMYNDVTKQMELLLSDIFVEISQKNNDPDYLQEFNKRFSSKGERIENDILTPIFENIQKTIESLNSIKILKSSPSDLKAIQQIEASFSKFQDEINKSISFGLYEDSRVKSVRDTYAESLRRVSIQINNEWDDTERALELVKKAKQITGTTSMENKLNDDIKQMTDLINQKNTIGKPISSAPTLYTLNGVGATIYGDTQYFVVIFIPIFPIARYSFEREGDSFRFFGKLELQPWQKIWQYLFIAFVGYSIINLWIFVFLAIWFIILKMQNKDII